MSEITIGDVSVSAQTVVDAIEDSGFYDDGDITYTQLETNGTEVMNAGESGPVTVVPDFDPDSFAEVTHHDSGQSMLTDVSDLYDRATEQVSSWENELKETFEAINGATGTEITVGEPTEMVYGDALVFVEMALIDGAWQMDSDTGLDAINGDVKYIKAAAEPNSSVVGEPFDAGGEGLLFYIERPE